MTRDTELSVDTKIGKKTEEPKKYNVVMLNDDYTPMEWVIEVLRGVFKHSEETSEKLTMEVHNDGSAVVGTYSYEIAEQKTYESNSLSRSYGFPLVCKIVASS